MTERGVLSFSPLFLPSSLLKQHRGSVFLRPCASQVPRWRGAFGKRPQTGGVTWHGCEDPRKNLAVRIQTLCSHASCEAVALIGDLIKKIKKKQNIFARKCLGTHTERIQRHHTQLGALQVGVAPSFGNAKCSNPSSLLAVPPGAAPRRRWEEERWSLVPSLEWSAGQMPPREAG